MTSRERFEDLYAQHAAAVTGYALRRTEPARAEDVVAEVFLVAWRRLQDVPHEPRPWLFGVARRVLANERRRVARHDALVDSLVVPAGARADFADDTGMAGGTLGAALALLSDTDREALLLTAWEGLNHRQAARVLSVREATFTVRLHRAKRRLARALECRQPTATSQTRLETQ